MISITTDASKGIFRLAKTGTQQDLHLNWTSEGFDLFLVLSSSSAEKVDLTSPGRDNIIALLADHLEFQQRQDFPEYILCKCIRMGYGSVT